MLRPFCENRGEAKRESIRRLVDGRDGDGADDEAGGRDGDDELMVWLWWEAEAWLLELLAKGAAHSRRWLGLMDEYLGRQRPPNNARLVSACSYLPESASGNRVAPFPLHCHCPLLLDKCPCRYRPLPIVLQPLQQHLFTMGSSFDH